MKTLRNILLVGVLTVLATSCGVHGDPGYVLFSLDWEYYSNDYAVTYYEDNNDNVPEWADIESQVYYECYPGVYDFYYESEDPYEYFETEGWYELEQILGSNGGVFLDGMDGADTYFDLFLYVDPDLMSRKKTVENVEYLVDEEGNTYYKESFRKTEIRGTWKLTFEKEVRVYKK